MQHLDLFSGIGGFSLAADIVWHEEKNHHTFVEYDDFCQAVLRKQWPESEINGDIRTFVANAKERRIQGGQVSVRPSGPLEASFNADGPHILTGGFPCQPFSQAGRRKGTEDDRYLWPPMLECVSLFRPRWVIAENVAGLASWNDGLVLETVCTDLEAEGYEVQAFVIPAVGIGAPHKRDRIWIIARDSRVKLGRSKENGDVERPVFHEARRQESADEAHGPNLDASDSESIGQRGWSGEKRGPQERQFFETQQARREVWSESQRRSWGEPWHEVAARLCRVDDGLPRRLDRNPRLKALGNAIVPQVAIEIMRAMRVADNV